MERLGGDVTGLLSRDVAERKEENRIGKKKEIGIGGETHPSRRFVPFGGVFDRWPMKENDVDDFSEPGRSQFDDPSHLATTNATTATRPAD